MATQIAKLRQSPVTIQMEPLTPEISNDDAGSEIEQLVKTALASIKAADASPLPQLPLSKMTAWLEHLMPDCKSAELAAKALYLKLRLEHGKLVLKQGELRGGNQSEAVTHFDEAERTFRKDSKSLALDEATFDEYVANGTKTGDLSMRGAVAAVKAKAKSKSKSKPKPHAANAATVKAYKAKWAAGQHLFRFQMPEIPDRPDMEQYLDEVVIERIQTRNFSKGAVNNYVYKYVSEHNKGRREELPVHHMDDGEWSPTKLEAVKNIMAAIREILQSLEELKTELQTEQLTIG
jgi:hypothetical protein